MALTIDVLKKIFTEAVNPQFTGNAGEQGVPSSFPNDGALVTFDVATLKEREPFVYDPANYDRTGEISTLISFTCEGTWGNGMRGKFQIQGVDGLALYEYSAENTAYVMPKLRGTYKNAVLYADDTKQEFFGFSSSDVKDFIDKNLNVTAKSGQVQGRRQRG